MTERIKLTDTIVQKLQPKEDGKRYFVWDTLEQNLGVRVTASGNTLVMRYRYLGKQYERNLDEQRNVHLARKEVEQRKVEIRSGNERLAANKARVAAEIVAAERKVVEDARAIALNQTLEECVHNYLKESPNLAERTVGDYKALLNNELAPYKTMALNDVTRQRAVEMLYEIAEKIKKANPNRNGTRANYAMRLVRSCCNAFELGCQNWGRVRGRRFPWLPTSEDDTLLDPEMDHGAQIWRILSGKRCDTGADYLKALMLTGCRPDEIAQLTVGQVDLRGGAFLLPMPKNKKPHTVYIAPQLHEILAPRLEGKDKTDKVFPGATDPKKLLAAVAKEIGVLKINRKCFRKYFHKNCNQLGIPEGMTAACLNHSPTTVTRKHYGKLTPGQFRNVWFRHADSICQVSGTVIQLNNHRSAA